MVPLDDWAKLHRVFYFVHLHTCGHASFSDMRILMQQNGLWNEQVQRYLAETVSQCSDCKASSPLPPNRRVPITSLDRAFNKIVRMDHLFLEDMFKFQVMDVSSRYSTGHVVSPAGITEAVYSLELIWVSQFWTPSYVYAHGAFQNKSFQSILDLYGIRLRPVPPR